MNSPKSPRRLFIELEPHLEDKLYRITKELKERYGKELNERYGFEEPVCAIHYLIMTYALTTTKITHHD